MHVVTIAARNYLPFVRLLAKSFKEHNANDTFVALVVDAEVGEVEPEADFEVATPADLPLDDEEFRRLALIYDVTELSTALKPWALEMLLLRGATTAVYLDPDICVFSSLAEIDQLSREHGIVLTPHAAEPIPRDGLRPTEADIMGSGVYNLGFIAVGKENVPMLRWWQERLRRDSISAPEQMLFTDQRWIDLVPGMWQCKILRDPGYNVAYWNLDHRPLERDGAQILAGGRPLRFFHFSGYRPESPWLLSKYVADNPRVVLSDHPIVAELCEDYGRAAIAAGMAAGKITPYRFNTLTDGTRVGRTMRSVYRAAVLEADSGKGEYPPVAFDARTESDLVAWFTEPRNGRLNRILEGLWKARPDLQGAFPNALRGDSAPFLDWAAKWGVKEGEIPPSWLPGQTRTLAATATRSNELGVNLAGYFAAELGMGQGGRLLIDAVRSGGLPYTTINSDRTLSRQQATFAANESDVRYPINIAFVNADQFPLWIADVGPDLLADRYTIGVWAWELEDFPDYPESFAAVDEIWGISKFVSDAVAKRTRKPVHVLPLPIPAAPEHIEPLDRAAIGLTDQPYFLFVFDYFSVLERKNPLATIAAFSRAFDEGQGPMLVLKTINGDRRRADRERLRQACAARSDILLVEDYLSAPQLTSLMANATAYVSLHRSEGYGLTMAESMALGRPVIATAYSGNLDFMSEDDSFLVPYTLVPVGPDLAPYPSTAHWAEPDIEVAAQHMRSIVDDPDHAREVGERARAAVARIGDPSAAAAFVRNRVEAIGVRPRRRRPASARAAAGLRRAASPVVRAVRRIPGNEATAAKPSVVLRAARRARRTARQLRSAVRSSDPGQPGRADAGPAVHPSGRGPFGKVRARLDSTDAHLAEVAHGLAEVRSTTAADEAILHDLATRLDATSGDVARIDFELGARPFEGPGTSIEVIGEDGRPYLGFTRGSKGAYAGFEDVFRGSEDFIKDRLRGYVPLVREHVPVLDVGCGRGEMLSLLAEEGVAAKGIDLDPSMLDRARARGLDVTQADALEYLAALPDASLGSLVSFQVIEHLPVETLRTLMAEAHRVLRPGGVFIAETVNPHSPPALKVFWLDITHVRPLFPESLLFLAQDCGFESGRIVFPMGSGNLVQDLRRCGEYAVVAYR